MDDLRFKPPYSQLGRAYRRRCQRLVFFLAGLFGVLVLFGRLGQLVVCLGQSFAQRRRRGGGPPHLAIDTLGILERLGDAAALQHRFGIHPPLPL